MANVVKIYELRSLGFDQLKKELDAVHKSLADISKLKRELNQQKTNVTDANVLKQINTQLKEEKIKTAELRLEKQRLINEQKVEQNLRQEALNKQKQTLNGLKAESESITTLTEKRKFLAAAIKSLNEQSTKTIAFDGQNLSRTQAIAQYQAINAQIKTMTSNMTGMQDIGTRMSTALGNAFSRMRGQLGQMILTYTGWFAVFREAGELISNNIRLTDSFADLQIRIKGSREDVEDLFEQLKKIDTRTSLKGLVDIANIVAKKGVPREELAGLTAEFDKLNVVLGTEIGEPSTATANIIKLITIFQDDKRVTAERVREIGNALFKLTTTGVATGEFLVNFAERVGAVRGITGLTLPSILGMGAALQQLGQRTEVAGTAAVQLTTRLFTDVPKFARAARMEVEAFRDLLAKDPFQALVAVAEGLKSLSGDELHANFEEVVKAFAEVQVEGVRVKAILGDIATNGKFIKERMDQAVVSMGDYATQSAAVELKQHTLAAVVQRVRKEFELIGTNKVVQVTMATIGAAILFLVSNLGIIIPILGIYAATWIIANSAMITARIATIASNVAFTAQYALLVITTTFTRAYTAALGGMTGATTGATAATRLLGIALRLLPLGIIITLIALLAAGCSTAKARLEGMSQELRNQAIRQQALIEVNEKANAAISEQVARLDTWRKVVENSAISIDTKRFAVQKLIEIDPKFREVLDGQTISLQKLRDVYKEVRDAILLNAQAQASAELTADKQKKLLDITGTIQSVEIAFAGIDQTKKRRDIPLDKLTKTQREIIKEAGLGIEFEGDLLIKDHAKYLKLIEKLKELQTEAQNVYDQYLDVQSGFQSKLTEADAKRQKEATVALETRGDLTIPELELLIKQINAELDTLREGDEKIKELHDKRDAFQKRLDALKGKKDKAGRPYFGSFLSGEAKDDFSEINAKMNAELAQEQARFIQLQINNRATFDEEIKHLENMAAINQRYLAQKIQRLESEKSLNAKEKEVLSSLRKDRLDFELKLQRDIQVIHDRQFALEQQNLKTTLDNQIKAINLRTNAIDNDATLSFTEKAQAKLDADKEILKLQEQFNADIDALEKKLNQRSKENADEGAKTREQIMQGTLNLANAAFKDAAVAADKDIDKIRIRAAEATIALLNSNKSATTIAREIQKIRNEAEFQIRANEIARLRIELELYEKGHRDKIRSEQEYLAAKAKLKEAEAKMAEDTTKRELNAIQRFIGALKELGQMIKENILGIKTYTKDSAGEAQRQADALAEALDKTNQAIDEAYEGFFEKERQKITDAYDAARERLDLEQEQVRARAGSQAEIESLDKQFAARRKQLDKEEGEKQRQLALKKLAIDFAVFVVRALATYQLPFALIPIAAGTLLYFIQRANINSQKFEKGGIAPTKTGGPIEGPSHKEGGVPFEAEGKELMIINKNSAADRGIYTMTGTARQIASKVNQIGGGIEFSAGATSRRHFETGGLLGTNFPAPVFNGSGNGQDNLELIAETRNLVIATNKRIDRLEVVQDTDTVTNAQRKKVRQTQIGTL